MLPDDEVASARAWAARWKRAAVLYRGALRLRDAKIARQAASITKLERTRDALCKELASAQERADMAERLLQGGW